MWPNLEAGDLSNYKNFEFINKMVFTYSIDNNGMNYGEGFLVCYYNYMNWGTLKQTQNDLV